MYMIAAFGAACVVGLFYLQARIKRRIARPYGKAIAEIRVYYQAEADRDEEKRLYDALMQDLGGEG